MERQTTFADIETSGRKRVTRRDRFLREMDESLPWGELVAIVDVTNGARLETYTIAGERGSGVLGINGAAAHLVHPGDLVILIAYATMEDAEARRYRPRVVFVDADNRPVDLGADPAFVPPDASELMSPR